MNPTYPMFISNDGYVLPCTLNRAPADKEAVIKTFLHYSDPTSRQERTVFGAKKEGLFYNYDDRLHGSKWSEGAKKATAAGLTLNTALWFEAVINHFHDTQTVDLQHVILGCNRSSGFSYLVFGYTYSTPTATP